MEGLNCGMQIQTRACSSGTWDLCTNKDMKKMLPCSDPDKEIEGCGKNNKTSILFKYLNHSSKVFRYILHTVSKLI